MNLYTIQSFDVIVELLTTGKYFCKAEKCSSIAECDDLGVYFRRAYDWLVPKLEEKIGRAPEGIKYPVWAWNAADEDSDEDWKIGVGEVGKILYRIDFVMDEKDLVASDFDKWNVILSSCPLGTDAEWSYWESLKDEEERESYCRKTWDDVFNIDEESVAQYNFWELKYENVIKITPFVVPADGDDDEEAT